MIVSTSCHAKDDIIFLVHTPCSTYIRPYMRKSAGLTEGTRYEQSSFEHQALSKATLRQRNGMANVLCHHLPANHQK